MSVKIYNTELGVFKDAETPKIYDNENSAWKDSIGMIYDNDVEAWKEVWSSKKEPLYIIKDGVDVNSSLTGGWKWIKVVGNTYAYWNRNNSKCLMLQNAYNFGSTNYYITNNPIPLSDYNTLYTTCYINMSPSTARFDTVLCNNNTFKANNTNDVYYTYIRKTGMILSKQTYSVIFTSTVEKYLSFGIEVIGNGSVNISSVNIYDVWLEQN